MAKPDVCIDGLSSDTTEDDVRAHLMDIHVNQILSILKVKSDVLGMPALRVTIADETIKHNVYNRKNVHFGIRAKPFRFYESPKDLVGYLQNNAQMKQNHVHRKEEGNERFRLRSTIMLINSMVYIQHRIIRQRNH